MEPTLIARGLEPPDNRTDHAPSPEWDAIVIGAGVAGSAAALHLARSLDGKRQRPRILLVERSDWPRTKVCGCCLNRAGVAMLDRAGVLGRLRAAGAREIHHVEIRHRHRTATLAQAGGICVPRATLDALLVEAAIEAGVEFAPGCSARVLPTNDGLRCDGSRTVVVKDRERFVRHQTRLVIAADGLDGSSLDALPEFQTDVMPRAWLGVGASINATTDLCTGVIQMFVGDHGYVGLIRLDDRTTNLAAALDPRWARSVGGPHAAVRKILESCASPRAPEILPALPTKFRGTPLLTRRRRCVASPGILVLGDAAGYVEPFTGEGMTWALASAESAAGFAANALLMQTPEALHELTDAWRSWHKRAIRPRQRTCRRVRSLVHRPALVGIAMTLLQRATCRRILARAMSGRLGAAYLPPAEAPPVAALA